MWVCEECRGTDIWRDAYINPNDYSDILEFDDFYCNDCGGECHVIYKEDEE